MNSLSKLFNKAWILPCIVLCLSLLSLCNQPAGFDKPGFYLSIAGLLGVSLSVLDFSFSRMLFYIWIAAQLFIINGTGDSTTTIADLTQGFKLPVFLPVKLTYAGYQLGINFFALGLLGIAVATKPKELLGSTLFFSSYRHDNTLGIVFPIKGRAEKYVTLVGERDWLLVKMAESFKYKNRLVLYVLVKRGDKLPIVKYKTNQLVLLKPLAGLEMINESLVVKTDIEEEAWAFCK